MGLQSRLAGAFNDMGMPLYLAAIPYTAPHASPAVAHPAPLHPHQLRPQLLWLLRDAGEEEREEEDADSSGSAVFVDGRWPWLDDAGAMGGV